MPLYRRSSVHFLSHLDVLLTSLSALVIYISIHFAAFPPTYSLLRGDPSSWLFEMRWLSAFVLVQLLCVFVMALPPAPSPPLGESNALALRAPGEVEAFAPLGDTLHESSLQKRATPPLAGAMTLYYATASMPAVGAVMLYRGGNDEVAYMLIGAGLTNFVVSGVQGIWKSLTEMSRMAKEDKIEEAEQHVRELKTKNDESEENYREKELAYKNAELEFKKKQLEANKNDHGYEHWEKEVKKNQTMREEVKAKREDDDYAQKLHDEQVKRDRETEKHALDMRKAREDYITARRTNTKAASQDHYDAKIDALKKLLDDRSQANEPYKKAKEALEEYKKADDPKERRKHRKTINENLDSAHKIIKKNEKKYQDFLDDSKGKQMAGDDSVESLLEKGHVVPGTFPERRRRLRSDSSLPRLVREQNSDCDTGYCHRVWYVSHQPRTEKRSLPGQASPYQIHDLHMSPLDFEFRRDGSLQRRGLNETEVNVGATLAEDDCVYEAEGDDETVDIHVRVLMQYGGDFESLTVFRSWSAEGFVNQWMEDIKKLPTKTVKGKKLSTFISEGLSCWSFDIDKGDPAMWLAYAISTDTKYTGKNAEDLLNECKQRAK